MNKNIQEFVANRVIEYLKSRDDEFNSMKAELNKLQKEIQGTKRVFV